MARPNLMRPAQSQGSSSPFWRLLHVKSQSLCVEVTPRHPHEPRPPMLTQALLVDDSRSVLNFLKHHIEAEGLVEATTFLDPVDALVCARERVFDLVLVDYEMPHMDGHQLHPHLPHPARLLRHPDRDDHFATDR
ncbi:hypothetical protein ACVWZZ_006266 [Bradyrhizobium sp. LM6.10]